MSEIPPVPRGLNKPWYDQLLDQTAHLLGGGAIVTVFFVVPMPYAGAVVGGLAGILREITEGGNVVSWGSLLDVLFWALGGLGVALLLGMM